MHPYFDLKVRLNQTIRLPLPDKKKGSELVGVYFNPSPDRVEDEASFYLFRKFTAFQYPLIYFYPEGKKLQEKFTMDYQVYGVELPKKWFVSKVSYSQFMTSLDFYSHLENLCCGLTWYLIFQKDSFLIQSGIEEWMQSSYDYLGAVWEKGVIDGGWSEPMDPQRDVKDEDLKKRIKLSRVGNGGLSLRRFVPCREVCKRYSLEQLTYPHEDTFYSAFGQLTGLKIAPETEARKFSWEDAPAIKFYIQQMKISKPLGFHNLPLEMAELLLQQAFI